MKKINIVPTTEHTSKTKGAKQKERDAKIPSEKKTEEQVDINEENEKDTPTPFNSSTESAPCHTARGRFRRICTH